MDYDIGVWTPPALDADTHTQGVSKLLSYLRSRGGGHAAGPQRAKGRAGGGTSGLVVQTAPPVVTDELAHKHLSFC
jgi:hypothetical protein